LSSKFKNGEVIFVSDLELRVPKTKEAREVLASLSKASGANILNKKKNSVYIALASKDVKTEKSFRNFNNLLVDEIRNLNPLDLMKYKYVLISDPEKGLPQISGKLK
jgi:ribosomal protein L4